MTEREARRILEKLLPMVHVARSELLRYLGYDSQVPESTLAVTNMHLFGENSLLVTIQALLQQPAIDYAFFFNVISTIHRYCLDVESLYFIHNNTEVPTINRLSGWELEGDVIDVA